MLARQRRQMTASPRQFRRDVFVIASVIAADTSFFSTDCDMNLAKETAERILVRLSRQEYALAGLKPALSIGISHEGANTDFSRMYRDADEALYQARVEGRELRIGMFEPWAAAATRGDANPNVTAAPG